MPYRATEATEATRARRRDALLAAATAIVARSGFQAASVKSVAARAGMSVGSVYLFFPTKSELLAAVFRRSADIELAAVRSAVHEARDASAAIYTRGDGSHASEAPRTAAAELSALVLSFARRAIRGRQLAWSLLLEPVERAIDLERLEYRSSYTSLVVDILRRGIRSGELADQDPELSGAAIVGAISEALAGPLSPLRTESGAAAHAERPEHSEHPEHPEHPEHTEHTEHASAVISHLTALCLRAAASTTLPAEPVADSPQAFTTGSASSSVAGSLAEPAPEPRASTAGTHPAGTRTPGTRTAGTHTPGTPPASPVLTGKA